MIKLTAVAALAVTLAPTAHADTTDYFDYLRRSDIAITDPKSALDAGLAICTALGRGMTPAQAAISIYRNVSWATESDAASIVVSAVLGLCPEHKYELDASEQQIA